MKQLFLVVLLAIVLFVAGCSSGQNGTTTRVDTSECDSLESLAKYSCLQQVAVREKSIVPCDEIKGNDLPEKNNRESCYMFVAKGTGNSALCDRITSAQIKDLCEQQF